MKAAWNSYRKHKKFVIGFVLLAAGMIALICDHLGAIELPAPVFLVLWIAMGAYAFRTLYDCAKYGKL